MIMFTLNLLCSSSSSARYGVGVGSNATRAAELFAMAAEQGDIIALREKAILFSSGHAGHTISEALAVLYLSLASASGDNIASSILGVRHLTGNGVPRCCSCAVKLLLPVAKDIIKSAVVPSGAPQLERRRVTRAMAAGFSRSEHRDFQSDSDVYSYHVYSSAHGDIHSIMQLASIYLHGTRGIRRNFTEAAKWFGVASEMGDVGGMVSLGAMALKGLGMPVNTSEAVRLFQKAMSLRHPGGYNGMGYLYLHGIGVEQDMKRAKDCFDRAIEFGSADAKFNVGAMMLGGFGVTKDYAQALTMFSHAANMVRETVVPTQRAALILLQGHLHALFNVAMMHLNGFGTQRNCQLASTYLRVRCCRAQGSGVMAA
jgi:TPR repeat protein